MPVEHRSPGIEQSPGNSLIYILFIVNVDDYGVEQAFTVNVDDYGVEQAFMCTVS